MTNVPKRPHTARLIAQSLFVMAISLGASADDQLRPDPGRVVDSPESLTGTIVIHGLDQIELSDRRPDLGKPNTHRILIHLRDRVQPRSFLHEYIRTYRPTRESYDAMYRAVSLAQACIQDELGVVRIDLLNRFGLDARDMSALEMRYVRPSDLISAGLK